MVRGGGQNALADFVAHRADQAAAQQRRLADVLDQKGRGRLAVRAGDAGDFQALRRMLVESSPRGPPARSRASGTTMFVARVLSSAGLADDRLRARGDGLVDELRAVHLLAFQRDEKRARLHPARIVGDRR